MFKCVLLACLLAVVASSSYGKEAVSPPQCKKIKSKIAKVNSQLRAGYKVKKGEKLKEKYRQLKKVRNQCKRKRYPIN